MRADAADTLHQRDCLNEIALLAEFFDSAIVVADENLAVFNLLAFDEEPCMNRLLKGRMIWSDRNGIAHEIDLLPLILSKSGTMQPA